MVDGSSKAGRRLAFSLIYPTSEAQVLGDKRSSGAAIGDVNGDGAPDIVFAGRNAANKLFINQGNGQFPITGLTLPGGTGINSDTMDVLMGDFNNDNHMDIFIANANHQDQQLLLHDGSESDNPYPNATVIPITGGPSDLRPSTDTRSAHAVDINKDGNLDVLISGYGPESMVLLGNGDGTFPTFIHLDDADELAYGIRAADLDGDGDLDIVVGYGFFSLHNTTQIYLNDGNTTTLAFTKLLLPGAPGSLNFFLTDFNGDGHMDIATGSGTNLTNKLVINNGDNPPTFTISDLPGFNEALSFSIDGADVNGDGAIDLVITYHKRPSQLLLNNGTGGFDEADVYDLPEPGPDTWAKTVHFGDLNGDSKPDIVCTGAGSYSGSTIRHIVLINNASTFSPPTTTSPTSSPTTRPTMLPTSSPTLSPTRSPPWDIVFTNMTVDFSVNSTHEVVQSFQIGKGRDFEYDFFTSDCETKTDIAGVASVTSKKSAGADAPHDALSLSFDFNKSAIATSGIWNASASIIEFCQKLRLKQGDMHIVEDVRKIDVVFDLNADFNFTNRLGGGTTNAVNESTSADDYVTAFKCNGGDFNNITTPLVPNGELLVCIESSSGDFEIEALESMVRISLANPHHLYVYYFL